MENMCTDCFVPGRHNRTLFLSLVLHITIPNIALCGHFHLFHIHSSLCLQYVASCYLKIVFENAFASVMRGASAIVLSNNKS